MKKILILLVMTFFVFQAQSQWSSTGTNVHLTTWNDSVVVGSIASVTAIHNLDVRGNIRTSYLFTEEVGESFGGIIFGTYITDHWAMYRSNNDLFIKANSSTPMMEFDGDNQITNINSRLRVNGGTMEFNTVDRGDYNFRISGTGANVFFLDAGTNKIKINGNTPLYDLDVGGTLRSTHDAFFNKDATIGEVLKLTPMSSAPSSPSEGWIYSNSTDNHLYFYDGTSWKQLD